MHLKQASEPAINRDKGIPIARFGHRVSINDDLYNNVLEDQG